MQDRQQSAGNGETGGVGEVGADKTQTHAGQAVPAKARCLGAFCMGFDGLCKWLAGKLKGSLQIEESETPDVALLLLRG